jgi:hypothetical protein
MFRDPLQARDAIVALKEHGFAADAISVLTPGREEAVVENGGEAIGSGILAGGFLGGLAGWLVGLSSFVIPGVGPFIGAGVLASMLTGAALGAGAGGVKESRCLSVASRAG